jgi:hypothetical protein
MEKFLDRYGWWLASAIAAYLVFTQGKASSASPAGMSTISPVNPYFVGETD